MPSAPHIEAAESLTTRDLAAGFYAAAASVDDWSVPWAALCSAFCAETGLLYRQFRSSSAIQVLAACNWPGLPAGAPGLSSTSSEERLEDPHVLSATIPIDDTVLVGLGLHRPLDAPRFTDADRRALDGVGHHVASALKLETMLAASRASSDIRGAALDQLAHGVIVCNAAGALLFANQAAQAFAAANDLDFGMARACVAGLTREETIRLEALIGSVARGGEGGTMRIARRPGKPAIAAIVEPLPVRLEAAPSRDRQRMLVMITLRDLAATTDASPALLIDLFGLTPAEAGIVPQLLAGDTASLIAQSRGVAVSTVKAQLAKVLAKTGATNLRALASMISSLA